VSTEAHVIPDRGRASRPTSALVALGALLVGLALLLAVLLVATPASAAAFASVVLAGFVVVSHRRRAAGIG
jgi:hypothetical protein